MKHIKYAVVLLAMSIMAFSCARQPKNTDEVVETFFYCVKNGDYDKIKSLRAQCFVNDTEGDNIKLKLLHDYLAENGIPTKDKWKISYDTNRRILKTKMYAVEIYRKYDQKEKRNKGAVIDFTFDYERTHTRDSIMWFNLHSLWNENN